MQFVPPAPRGKGPVMTTGPFVVRRGTLRSPTRGRLLRSLPVGSIMAVPAGNLAAPATTRVTRSTERWRTSWATTRATCATSSSTSSRSSGARTCSAPGPTPTSTPTPRGSILHEVERLAENELAESLLDSDRNPPVLRPGDRHGDDARVVQEVLPGLHRRRVVAPRRAGRARRHGRSRRRCAGRSPSWCCGANPAVHMYASGSRFAQRALATSGTDEQRSSPSTWSSSRWGATMVLTEPDAGSDVGAGRTKAVQQPDGTWHIKGVKRFITSAEHDMADNIVHLVLARPEGAGPGTKGLSLFVVPKFHVDRETGELGERNGVYVTNVEHKMGLKVSTTCELTFGEQRARRRQAARRGARRHRADVQGHRVRPDDGRHQGDRDAVDRLPQRARLREDARAGRRPDADDRQGRAARHDHAPPRRPPLAHAAEGVRRGPARARALHRRPAGHRRPGAAGDRTPLEPGSTPSWPTGSTTCCCRSSRASARSGPGAARHRVAADLRRVRLPAGLPDRAVRPRRQDRHALRGHHRDPGPGLLLPQDRARQGPGAAAHLRSQIQEFAKGDDGTAAAATPSASCSARRSRTCRASSATWSASS